ncbi:MAG: 7-cyano-7-deazaguanine synthase QueC [Gemmatimonadaceae bacterium]|nr:7-cyano-7-deazaguanine synthase QueC [Gemmatimonadaceae bacterium]
MRDSGKAVVLLSGGLDSATTAAVAIRDGFELHALSLDYGQRHVAELDAAKRVARDLAAAQHVVVQVDLRAIGGSALTADMVVPKNEDPTANRIPVTYVPARNTLLLSLALGWAEVIGAFDIFIGVNALDYSGYPDCRPEFIRAFEKLANVATKAGTTGGTFTIHAPLIDMSKADIIRLGTELGVNFASTLSCYDPDPAGRACGECDACQLRLRGFAEAGLADPIAYARG